MRWTIYHIGVVVLAMTTSVSPVAPQAQCTRSDTPLDVVLMARCLAGTLPEHHGSAHRRWSPGVIAP